MQTSVSSKNNTVALQIQIKFASAVRVIKTSLLTSWAAAARFSLWPDAFPLSRASSRTRGNSMNVW
jgi:hypothetical protein